jgi:cyclomaltodextrinase
MRIPSSLSWLLGLAGALLSLPSRAQTDVTPAWSKGVVWYQIFPERFRNGDLHNDPQASDQRGAYPFNDSAAFQIHPWGSDWYALKNQRAPLA